MMMLIRLLIVAASTTGSMAAPSTFSYGVAQTDLTSAETQLFSHTLSPNASSGALTYFWLTGGDCVGQAVIRMFIDDEPSPSLVFEPAKAAGMGFANSSHRGDLPPWGNKWIGSLGRNAYYLTLRVPFQASLRVTYQQGVVGGCKLWIQARGSEGLELSAIIPGVTLPPTARLHLQVREQVTYAPLDYMVVADVPANTSGALFFSTIWWHSSSPNTIEGCWRAFTPRAASYPGIQLSTGWEDYYAASWGFIAGAFTTDLSGNTFWTAPGNLLVSTYRFHDHDPLFFNDGLLLVQRNGETYDAEGVKCRQETGGTPQGNPGITNLSSYAWYYSY
jgi:hypothetical protein